MTDAEEILAVCSVNAGDASRPNNLLCGICGWTVGAQGKIVNRSSAMISMMNYSGLEAQSGKDECL